MISVVVSIICYGVILGNATYSGTEVGHVYSGAATKNVIYFLSLGNNSPCKISSEPRKKEKLTNYKERRTSVKFNA